MFDGSCRAVAVVAAVTAAGVVAAAIAGPPDDRSPAMKLTSTAFAAGGTIPARHTCDGADVSPALEWTGAPEGTKTFALIVDDPDAPPGTWVHWVLFDLPGDRTSLGEGIAEEERPGGGAVHGACWGVSSFSRIGYHGPCPPPGGPHRYVFRLYALDTALGLPPRATRDQVLRAAEGHVLATAELVGKYSKRGQV